MLSIFPRIIETIIKLSLINLVVLEINFEWDRDLVKSHMVLIVF